MIPNNRTIRATVLAISLVAAGALSSAAPAAAATTNCSIVWGSLPKSSPPMGAQGLQFLINARSGQHPCYDRVVFDLHGNESGPVGYSVEYLPTVRSEADGSQVPLAGGATLRVFIRQGSFDYGSLSSAYNPVDPAHLVNVNGYRTLRQVAWADDFSADTTTTVGIGVRARLPMRAFILPSANQFNGQRLVIDIAHHW